MKAKFIKTSALLLSIILVLIYSNSLAQINNNVYNYRLMNINNLHGYYFIEESLDLVDSIEILLIGMDGNPSENYFFIEIKYDYSDSVYVDIIHPIFNNKSKYNLKKGCRYISFRVLNTEKWCSISFNSKRIILVVEKFESNYLISSIRELSELELLEIRNDIQHNRTPKLVLQEVCIVKNQL